MRIAAAATGAFVVFAAAAAARAETRSVPSEAYPTIQSAVNAAEPGDVISIGPGTYIESVSVDALKGVQIRGRGRPVIEPLGAVAMNLDSCEEVRIAGIDLGGFGIVVESSTDVVLDRLRITHSGSDGQGIGSFQNDGLLVSRCTVAGDAAYGLWDIGTVGLVVEKCRFEGNWLYGILLSDADTTPTAGAVVSRNRIIGAEYGLLMGGADNVIEKNRFEGIVVHGITTWFSVDGSVVSGNRVEVGGNFGIQVLGTGYQVVGNTFEGGGTMAINGTGVLLDRNRVIAAVGTGISVQGSAHTLSRNQVRGATLDGILVAANDVVVDRNLVTGADDDGIVVSGSLCELTRNRVSAADDVGILVANTPNTITGNRSSGNGNFDLADTSAPGANSYEGNRFGNEVFFYD
jgi:nitrous oxidase accessory protein NosD